MITKFPIRFYFSLFVPEGSLECCLLNDSLVFLFFFSPAITNVSCKSLILILKCLIPQAWSSFGEGCKKASVIFKLQSKNAYRFLEVSPSSLSLEQWQKEYESVKEQLEKIDLPHCVTSSNTPAISE